MDHRISKDMISSGMIPSGEKNQEDLGKTQYGTVPSPNALSDVYKKMYETKEEVINEHHKKDADGNTIPHEGEELNEGKMPDGLQAYLDKKKKVKEGYQRNPEKDPEYNKDPDRKRSRAERMADPKTGINSPAFKKFMASQGM